MKITEAKAKKIFSRIARAYKPNAKFMLDFIDPNDDLELVKALSIYAKNGDGSDHWATIAYLTANSAYKMPQPIAVGMPHTCKHALEMMLWCLERRDVGFWWRFGNDTTWNVLFKKGTSFDEMMVQLDMAVP